MLPGQVGTLVDEHANLVDVTATIVDLAVRGWLTITDLDKDYELTANPTVGKGTLLPYETALMNALFGAGPTVKLSDLKYKFRAAALGDPERDVRRRRDAGLVPHPPGPDATTLGSHRDRRCSSSAS